MEKSNDVDKKNLSTNAGNQASNSEITKRKSRIPWLAVFALAMGMLVYGVAESYGPVAAITSLIPSNLYYLGLSLGFIAGGFGALLAGYLTDNLGRRNSFLVVAVMIIIGIGIYLAAPTNAAAIIISFVLVGMAAIGMETPILTAISESISAKYRGNILIVVQNFGNIGIALVFIPALIGLSAAQDSFAYALLFIAPLIALIIGYFSVKETLPWESATGKAAVNVQEAWKNVDGEAVEHAIPTVGIPLRWIIIAIIGIVQDVSFIWITYDIGFLYFTEYAVVIPIIASITAITIGMIFAIFFVNRISRKNAALLASGSLLILWLIFWAYVDLTGSTSGLLLLALIASLYFGSELMWGVRAMLEPEVFPTARRGTYISLARATVWIVAGVITLILSLYLFPTTSAQFIPFFNISSAVVAIVFLLGLIASIVWFYKGFETSKKSLSGIDLQAKQAT